MMEMHTTETLTIEGDPDNLFEKLVSLSDRVAFLIEVKPPGKPARGTCEWIATNPLKKATFVVRMSRRMFGNGQQENLVQSVVIPSYEDLSVGTVLTFKVPIDPDSDKGILLRAADVLKRMDLHATSSLIFDSAQNASAIK